MVSFLYPGPEVAHACRCNVYTSLSLSLALRGTFFFLAGNCENSENENQMQTPQPAENMTQKTQESQEEDEASHRSALCGHCSVECIRKIVLKGRLVGLQMMHTAKRGSTSNGGK